MTLPVYSVERGEYTVHRFRDGVRWYHLTMRQALERAGEEWLQDIAFKRSLRPITVINEQTGWTLLLD